MAAQRRHAALVEEELWTHPHVRWPATRILSLSILTTFLYGAFVLLICVATGLVPFLMSVSIGWPTYGGILQISQVGLFLVGIAAEASASIAFVGLCGFLTLLVTVLDVVALAALVSIVIEFYAGTLTAAQQAADVPAGITGVLAAGGINILIVMCDIVNLLSYILVIQAVITLRRRLKNSE